MAEQLADPGAPSFVGSLGDVFVVGGLHVDTDWCWCQPAMEMHGCGHRHGVHRAVMD